MHLHWLIVVSCIYKLIITHKCLDLFMDSFLYMKPGNQALASTAKATVGTTLGPELVSLSHPILLNN